jgi:hypothetical protein
MLIEFYEPASAQSSWRRVLGMRTGAINNQIGADTFPIQTCLDCGKPWADFSGVAAHRDW